jgi:glycosyltransferase involved in cell wall biosynthesis
MTGDTVGGVWTFTLELARQLTARGAEVWLATFGGAATPAQRRQAAAIAGLHLFDSDLKLEWMEDPWDDVAESCSLVSHLAQEFRPDLVHLNTYAHGDIAWAAPVILTAHSCVASWWAAVRGGQLPSAWNKYRDRVLRSLQAADLVTTPTVAMLEAVLEHYGSKLPRTRVIANGCDSSRFKPGVKEPFILSAGRLWDEGKNVAALSRIASRLSWPVYLAGEQRNGEGSAVTPSDCRLLGQLSQETLATWYARAPIYALPARYEPFGLSALEAALSSCALVLGDIPSLREVWGDRAVFVPPNDGDALRAAIQDLIDDPVKREQVAHRCRNRAQQFTAEHMSAEYLAAYHSAADSRSACAS